MVVVVGAGLVAGTGSAVAQGKREGFQFEVGVSGGAHVFADDVELGVADDPALTSPKNGPLGALRIGLFPHPMFGLELEGVGIPTSDRQNDLKRVPRRRPRVAGLQHHAGRDRGR